MDPDHNGVEKSRLVMFEYASRDPALLEVHLVMIGQWSFDGLAHGIGMHRDPDGLFIHIS